MSKIVMFECDWCRVQAPPATGYVDVEWPKGWSNLDELGNEDLLCADCIAHGKKTIAEAIEKAKYDRLAALPSGALPEDKR